MAIKRKIFIKNGQVKFIYDDELRPFMVHGVTSITRVSHVEPTSDGKWAADLSPVAPGVSLGPFDRRQDALNAEKEWLEQHFNQI